MKREILFRGWSEARKEWIYGGICEYVADNPPHQRVSITMPVGPGIDVIPETVGQYTGLTDKNGVKIFEGDKLNIKGIEGSVSFLHGGFCYFDGDAEYTFQTAIGWGNWEITGNIHDK